ncbi:MAG TPA: alpha/beta hydrolase [Nitrososphaeraceae archaeon]|nr:alpha/beta hydrolase [Nitrososphaeraceae archaeon]
MVNAYYCKNVEVDKYLIRYYDIVNNSSNRPAILFLHGLGGSAERWTKIIPSLSSKYRLIIPDIIGFGYSEKPHVEYTVDFFINFIKKFLNILNISDVIIIGSSFGGLLALEYAMKYNDTVKKLILVSPAGMMRYVTPTLKHYISAALYPTYENVLRAYKEMVYDSTIANDVSILDFINRMNLQNSKYAFMSTLMGFNDHPNLNDRLKIDIPTLIIWGRYDKLIPVRYAKKFKIPNSRIVIIDHCGHYPHLEKIEIFTKTLTKFLDN